ncbi:tRNA1(Val) (adenine(37)-N6)-methyltransferase [Vibrio aerogenes CECT 7868]|uniref:tRNA1(Val) (adenine(37)-N6)-methyltransferase n=1 Tax=Vibrio aerogenes CECT 7868 TaxID=1216006 RepID=A0A1M5YAI4_9VIBR|nr:methyltransferase [Vibrio aerogenes]SHI08523.1 tRNA1(Val) (adenine(37)-N6)-methyltransferase [Vibrio aerogenes CECT 7868]
MVQSAPVEQGMVVMNKQNKLKTFSFKQFSLTTGNCGMPVSTDSVILGAWSRKPSSLNPAIPPQILDIGTGTGILALMCAQRFSEAEITAIDIDSEAIQSATMNFQQSPWQARIQIKHQDVLTCQTSHKFDAIICNPPYFNSGQTASVSSRATARHTIDLSHQQLLQVCHTLLTSSGKASFILPVNEGELFIQTALNCGWSLSRYCAVQPTIHKPCHRLLMEFSPAPVSSCEKTTLIIRDNQHYSDDFVLLTKDFYLKM